MKKGETCISGSNMTPAKGENLVIHLMPRKDGKRMPGGGEMLFDLFSTKIGTDTLLEFAIVVADRLGTYNAGLALSNRLRREIAEKQKLEKELREGQVLHV